MYIYIYIYVYIYIYTFIYINKWVGTKLEYNQTMHVQNIVLRKKIRFNTNNVSLQIGAFAGAKWVAV